MTDLIERDAALALCDSYPYVEGVKTSLADLPAVTPATVGVPTDCRRWPYYPIPMPFTKDGKGPATIGVDAESISYEVWDCVYNSYASFDNLPDAINEAMRLSIASLTPTPVDASLTPDPVVKLDNSQTEDGFFEWLESLPGPTNKLRAVVAWYLDIQKKD